jgi:hypothetical protein
MGQEEYEPEVAEEELEADDYDRNEEGAEGYGVSLPTAPCPPERPEAVSNVTA